MRQVDDAASSNGFFGGLSHVQGSVSRERGVIGRQDFCETDIKPDIEVSNAERIFRSPYATGVVTSRESSAVALFERLSCRRILGRSGSRDGSPPARPFVRRKVEWALIRVVSRLAIHRLQR